MVCVLCYGETTDSTYATKTDDACKHKFDIHWLKVKYNLSSSIEAVTFVKQKCPVCKDSKAIDLINRLESSLAKLDKLDKLDNLDRSV